MVNRGGAGSIVARGRALLMLGLFVSCGAFLLKHDAGSVASPAVQPASRDIRSTFARLPISFEPNQGQTASQVRFLAHGTGYGVYFMPTEAVLTLPPDRHAGSAPIALAMELAGASRGAEIAGAGPLPGYSNYLIGNDPSRWHRHVPHFARVRYRGIYPNVDLWFYGKQNRLEYDFEVAPGGDPRQIELDFKGAGKPSLGNNGDLVVAIEGQELRFEAPHVYQELSSGIRPIRASFVLRGHRVGFEVGSYDRSRRLVIDPVLNFSTYLGGSVDESCTVLISASAGFVPSCPALAVDSASNIYVAGATDTPAASGFSGKTPTEIPSSGAPGPVNVFVSKISLSSSGSVLDFVTYIGGNGTQYPLGIGVDSGFNVYVAGTTNAGNYPTTASAFQTAPPSSGTNHVFVSKLDPTGASNLYSSYLFGNGVDTASGITVDSQGQMYLIGTTTSSNFPTTPGALQPSPRATNQFFFSKMNPSLSTSASLLYSTYIGGSTPSNGAVVGGAVAVDSSLNVYLAGGTNFSDMPVLNAYQSAPKASGATNVWAARLNAPAINTQQYTPLYETYVGGSVVDVAYGIATDNTNTYITGSTSSSDITIPTGTSPFQSSYGGGPSDAFVAKFGLPATSGTTQGAVPLLYFSYLGGSGQDVGLSIVADSLANARVTGLTASSNFPLATPFQGSFGGGSSDAFVARLVTTGTSSTTNTSTSSYFGGSGTDIGTSIALDSALNTYLAGETSSPNFPTATPLPAGGTLSGPTDAFVSKIGPNTSGLSMPQITPAGFLPACQATNPTVSPSPVGVGSQAIFTYYIYNTLDPVPGVVFTDMVGTNTATVSASQGSCTSASNGAISCLLGTINTSTQTSVTPGPTNCQASISTNFAAKVTVTVTAPTTVLQAQSSLGNSAILSFPGTTLPGISGSALLNDYTVSALPPTAATITAGDQADYNVLVTPTGAGFPESVSLACGAGVPSGASCVFPNGGNPIANMSNGPQSRVLGIKTTPRVTTPSSLFRPGPTYAVWLPILGVGFVGAGISRRRRLLLALFFTVVLGMALLQAACSSSSRSTQSTTGTPPGTYTITINGTSGGATRSTTVQLTVQ